MRSFFDANLFEALTANNVQTQMAQGEKIDRTDLDLKPTDAGFTVSSALCYCAPCVQCHGNFVKASETPRCTGSYAVVPVLYCQA